MKRQGIPPINGAGGLPRPQQGGSSTRVHGQPSGSTMMPSKMLKNLNTPKKGLKKEKI